MRISSRPVVAAVRRPRHVAGLGAGLACAALILGGCSGGGAASAAAASATSSSPPSFRNRGPVPGANGVIAAISGHTVQVQGGGTQTAVTYTSSTRFTATSPTHRSSVRVGSCVVARSAQATASGPPTGSATAAPSSGASGSSTSVPVSLTAATVTLTPPSSGSCTTSFGGRGGFTGRPRPSGSAPSAGTEERQPGRGPGGFARFAEAVALGKVTAISPTTITVAGTRPDVQGSSSGTATAVPTTWQVTTTSTTQYEHTASAGPKALVVGRCLSATGSVDSTGAVTARSISVRPDDGSGCSGFQRFGRGRPGDGGASRAGSGGSTAEAPRG